MKRIITLISTLAVLSSAQADLLSSSKDLPTATELRLINVKKVIEGHNVHGFPTMNIKVIGTAIFTNSCVVPDSIVKETSRDESSVRIRVLGVSNEKRFCPMVVRPVEKTFLIETIGTTDIMPTIEVNGEII